MIMIPAEDLVPGMVVAQSIIDANHRVLLTSGQVLTYKYITRIQELGIPGVYIQEDLGIEEAPYLVSATTVCKATQTLKYSIDNYWRTNCLNVGCLRSQVDAIIDELVQNQGLVIGLTDLKSYDDYTYEHSVQVCIISLLIGITKGYNSIRLQEIGMGALLHDIGKTRVSPEIINKPGSLTVEERKIINRHTWEGFNIMRNSWQISLFSAHVALQHHERLDGSGYPRAIKGENIHEYAQIAAVADVYDALVSDRPYRSGYTNQEALAIINQQKGNLLSSDIVDILEAHVSLYPPGAIVELNTGDLAIVVVDNPEQPCRPKVRLLFDANGQVYCREIVDLAVYERIKVVRMLKTAEAGHEISRYFQLKSNQLAASRVI